MNETLNVIHYFVMIAMQAFYKKYFFETYLGTVCNADVRKQMASVFLGLYMQLSYPFKAQITMQGAIEHISL